MITEIALVIVIIFGSIMAVSYAITGEVLISVSISPSYHSCTVALDQRQDYYLEYENGILVNMTALDEPIILNKERITCG